MTDLAARIRAARAYADLTQKELAERLGIDTQSVKRTEGGRRDPKEPELRAIAEETGVPREFFTVGFTGFDTRAGDDGQLADHDDRMSKLADEQLGLMRWMANSMEVLLKDVVERAADPSSPATPADDLEAPPAPPARARSGRPKRGASESSGSQA